MTASRDQFDIIVVGGGIYGVMTALEASRRGQSVALLERDDWGSATTAGWLRILHGGLRYLQSADLARFFESVNERKWFLQQFPEYVEPLSCVMPLYNTHSHSPFVMRAGLLVNDVLSIYRNRGVLSQCHLPNGKIIDKDAVQDALPFVPVDGLRAGAAWYDGIVRQPQRLLMALVNWCRSNDVTCLNRHEVLDVLRTGDSVTGIRARSTTDDRVITISAPIVINATGHWMSDLVDDSARQPSDVPRQSWAWNILFDVPNNATHAAAVSARRAGSQVLFLLPWQGRAMLGTGHALIPRGSEQTPLPLTHIRNFIAEAAEAVPELGLCEQRVARVFHGRLPAVNSDEMHLTARPSIVDHARYGIRGLFSVWGIKYTTARKVAVDVVERACPNAVASLSDYCRPAPETNDANIDLETVTAVESGDIQSAGLRRFLDSCGVDENSRLRDLILRRSGVGDFPGNARKIATLVAAEMSWDEARLEREMGEFEAELQAICERR